MKAADVEKYIQNAKTCRRLAAATVHPEQKANWLMLATEWNRLAEAAEKVISK